MDWRKPHPPCPDPLVVWMASGIHSRYLLFVDHDTRTPCHCERRIGTDRKEGLFLTEESSKSRRREGLALLAFAPEAPPCAKGLMVPPRLEAVTRFLPLMAGAAATRGRPPPAVQRALPQRILPDRPFLLGYIISVPEAWKPRVEYFHFPQTIIDLAASGARSARFGCHNTGPVCVGP